MWTQTYREIFKIYISVPLKQRLHKINKYKTLTQPLPFIF